MKLIIQEITNKISNNFFEDLEKLIHERKDIYQFILDTKKTLDEVGTAIVAEALEIINEVYRGSKERKRNWIIKERASAKTLTTIFGEVHYKRTYYENKKTGEYSYLSDEAVGIEAHDRLDASLKTRLVEEAVIMPYCKSGEKASEAVTLTSQTVMNCIRELGNVENGSVAVKHHNKDVRILYIEADEDHVASQIGGCIEPKLVYVHEGREHIGKDRYKLVNPRYFSGVYSNSDDIWLEVLDYIDKVYDIDALEKIYLSGDGAPWIKNGANWIKGSVYVLDRYHLSKYVTQATAHMSYTAPIMWHYINRGDKSSLEDLFKVIIKETELQTKRRSVQEARRYILSNWEAVMGQYEDDYIGCSAEGHVSHILSDRLSSRPLGWSVTGVDNMSRLRVFVANGGNIYDIFIKKKSEERNEARMMKLDRDIYNRRKGGKTHETIGNITILNIGKRTWTSQYLKSIRDA